MLTPERILYKAACAAAGTLELMIQLASPAAARARECIPLSRIPIGRTINVADQNIDLPSEVRVRAIIGESSKEDIFPEPCLENPTYMLSRRSKGYHPYILVRYLDGEIVYEQAEEDQEPFAFLKEALSSLEPLKL